MPPRLRKRAKVTYAEEEDPKPEPTKAKKPKLDQAEGPKAKKTTSGGAVARRDRNIRGKRGGLEGMPDMPLDVLIEIFGFVHPRDLLNLARTTRAFRDFLMSREAAASFWKASRQQVDGLPEPPPGISEPAYANFLFFNHCHGCLTRGSHVVIYSRFLARYCKSCRDTWLLCDPTKVTANIIYEFRALIPATETILNAVIMKDGRHYTYWYQKAEVDRLDERWKALRRSTPEKRKALVQELKASVVERRKIADRLDKWHESVRQAASDEKDALKEERLVAVLNKLRTEGWGQEVDKMSEHSINKLATLEGVYRPTKLTERGWKAMRDTVLAFMQQHRTERLALEYDGMIKTRLPYLKTVLHEYVHSQWLLNRENDPVTYASVADCALVPEVRAILADPSEEVTQDSIVAKLTDLIPAVAAKWMEERKAQYREIAIKALGDSDAARASEPLDLALVAFKSRSFSFHPVDGGGETRYHFPRFLHHSCLREHSRRASTDAYEAAVKSASTVAIAGKHPIPMAERIFTYSDMVAVDDRFMLRREVITACGMNPDTATYAEMDACEARLRCRLCATLASQEVFNWRAAIQHGVKRHVPSYSKEEDALHGFWERVSDEHAAQARALEVSTIKQDRERTRYTNENIHCSWCWTRNDNISTMKTHMVERHNIIDPELDVDYFLETQPFSVWMYSPIFAECVKSSEKSQVEAGNAFYATF